MPQSKLCWKSACHHGRDSVVAQLPQGGPSVWWSEWGGHLLGTSYLFLLQSRHSPHRPSHPPAHSPGRAHAGSELPGIWSDTAPGSNPTVMWPLSVGRLGMFFKVLELWSFYLQIMIVVTFYCALTMCQTMHWVFISFNPYLHPIHETPNWQMGN